jgi:hypothetical protein
MTSETTGKRVFFQPIALLQAPFNFFSLAILKIFRGFLYPDQRGKRSP